MAKLALSSSGKDRSVCLDKLFQSSNSSPRCVKAWVLVHLLKDCSKTATTTTQTWQWSLQKRLLDPQCVAGNRVRASRLSSLAPCQLKMSVASLLLENFKSSLSKRSLPRTDMRKSWKSRASRGTRGLMNLWPKMLRSKNLKTAIIPRLSSSSPFCLKE